MPGSSVDLDWQTPVICAPLSSPAPLIWVSLSYMGHDDTRNVRRPNNSSFVTLEMPSDSLLLVLPAGTVLSTLLTDELRRDPLMEEHAKWLWSFCSRFSPGPV